DRQQRRRDRTLDERFGEAAGFHAAAPRHRHAPFEDAAPSKVSREAAKAAKKGANDPISCTSSRPSRLRVKNKLRVFTAQPPPCARLRCHLAPARAGTAAPTDRTPDKSPAS